MSNDTIQPPLWVALAFSNITKRKPAIWLIVASIVFTVGFGVWWLFFDGDWSWCAWTAPLPVWYILALRWMDANSAWESD